MSALCAPKTDREPDWQAVAETESWTDDHTAIASPGRANQPALERIAAWTWLPCWSSWRRRSLTTMRSARRGCSFRYDTAEKRQKW